MTKIASIILLALVLLTATTCKKISKYPLDLYGVWTSNHSNCVYMLLEIKKNGSGSYGSSGCCHGCEGKAEGKVRFNNAHLYVGMASLKFIKQPEIIETNDSLVLNYKGSGKTRILAKMTIKESYLRGNQTYTFYKVKDY